MVNTKGRRKESQASQAMASHRCELLRGLLVAYFLLASQVHSVNVAPNDGDELCLAHPLRESVPDTNKVVLDTQDYRETTLVTNSGDNMIWNSENFDNITDSTAIQQVSHEIGGL